MRPPRPQPTAHTHRHYSTSAPTPLSSLSTMCATTYAICTRQPTLTASVEAGRQSLDEATCAIRHAHHAQRASCRCPLLPAAHAARPPCAVALSLYNHLGRQTLHAPTTRRARDTAARLHPVSTRARSTRARSTRARSTRARSARTQQPTRHSSAPPPPSLHDAREL